MFYNLINLIKISIKHNKKGFLIKKTKKNINIIKIFMSINIIKFIKIDKKNIIVFINYINNKPIFVNIENFIKKSNKKFINLETLKKISFKYNCILILSTNKGVISNYDAIKLKVGGLIIAKIWN